MQKGRPTALSITFACITTCVKEFSLSRTVSSRMRARHTARERGPRRSTPDTTPVTALFCASWQHISSILQRLQDAHTGRWSVFSRHIQQLLTRYEINMTQAVPPHRTTDTTSDNLTKVHTGYSETRQSKGHRVNVDTS